MRPLRWQRLTWSKSGVIHQFGAFQAWLHVCAYGTRSIPQIDSTEPLWDQRQLTQEMHAGLRWLPDTISGERETLITSMVNAVPRHVLVLPTDGWTQIIATVNTVGFLLFTFEWIFTAFGLGVTSIAATCRWLKFTTGVAHTGRALVADGVCQRRCVRQRRYR